MSDAEKRKHIRLESLHLLDYIVIDSVGTRGRHAMGRTLDISESGIKIETNEPLIMGDLLVVTIGLEDDLIDLHGEVTNCRPASGMFVNGVQFTDIPEEGKKLLKKYSEAFMAKTKENND